ncbi:hypothetical protein EW093_17175 (plasmid) [Thiospirochaeta perfilievii]|uniref:XRE family transcriptional regulator n=1 Tax=Thiospirochaeta perfilievii TaxID=252967 RepID=A0A5C1QHH7_9SPIO|nr:hypothetical protein [Thiospirochaeta perfilievii]QEN06440.1 hypothetical protein EW093_17175 [Thiospirochaeta perfilievii]
MERKKSIDIKAIRYKNNWSRLFLAQKLETELSTIISWELGTKTPPKTILNKLNILAGIL